MTIAVIKRARGAVIKSGVNSAEVRRQAEIAEADADRAKAEADRAETNAGYTEEFLQGISYATQADGEAATAEGQFFRVPVGTTPETYARYQRTAGGSVEAASLATTADLTSTDPDKGAAIVKQQDGKSLAFLRAAADITLYVNAATGDDTTGDGSNGAPFATIQKAVDSCPRLTDGKTVAVEVAAGTYATSSRAAASMDRPAVVYIDGVRIGRRTAQSGSTLSGGLIIKLASGAKVTPNSTYPRGIYVTGHCGSVGIVGGEVEAATGAESLIVAHRGSYVHVRDTVADGNSISPLGLVCEAGGIMECIDVTASGATSADAICYANSFLQMAAPGGTATVEKITNTGHVDLAVGMRTTGTITNRARFTMTGIGSAPILVGGGYDGKGGSVYGASVHITTPTASIVAQSEHWALDALHSNAKLNFRACSVNLSAFQSYVAPATQSTHLQPIALLEDSTLSFSSTIDNVNSAGSLIGPDLSTQVVTVSADSAIISPQITARHHIIRLNNTKGSLATGCTLSLDMGWKSGQRIPNGQLVTLVNLGGNGVQIINGTTMTGANGSAVTVGASTGQRRSVTLLYLTDYGKWMPVSFGETV